MKNGFGMDRIPTASGFDGEEWDVVPGLKYPAALQDEMNQIVIPHRRPELIAGQAALRTTLVHI